MVPLQSADHMLFSQQENTRGTGFSMAAIKSVLPQVSKEQLPRTGLSTQSLKDWDRWSPWASPGSAGSIWAGNKVRKRSS